MLGSKPKLGAVPLIPVKKPKLKKSTSIKIMKKHLKKGSLKNIV